MSETLAVIAPGTSARTLRATAAGAAHVVVEDTAALSNVQCILGRPCRVMADLVPCVRDVYHPAVRTQTADLLRKLPAALGAREWSYGGVSLWDTVATEFHWRFLDSVFQAADIAADLLDGTSPDRVVISRPGSYVARALAAVAEARGIAVRFQDGVHASRTLPLQTRAIPYLAHLRDCAYAVPLARADRASRSAPLIVLNHALRNFQIVEPVLRRVQQRRRSGQVLVIQGASDGESEIRTSGWACRRFVSYASWNDGAAALAAVSGPVRFLTSGEWQPHMRAVGLSWDGVPLDRLAANEISFGLPLLLGAAAREIAYARRMLAAEQPSLVIMTEDRSGLPRAVAFVARAMGIPTLLVQWGPIAPNSTWLSKVAADVAAVEGDAAAEVLTAAEDGASLRVVVTGQPKYEHLCQRAARSSRREICGRLSLDPERPIVLLAAHPIREASATMKRNFVEEDRLAAEAAAVVRAVNGLVGVQLLVKPHPNEGTDWHKRFVEACGNADIRLVPKTDSAEPCLLVSDVVITRRSTLGLEGVFLAKPVMIVNFCGTPDAVPFVSGGVATGAYSPAGVKPALEAALFDRATHARMAERRPAFLRRYIAPAAVSAIDRMAELVLSLADGAAPALIPAAML